MTPPAEKSPKKLAAQLRQQVRRRQGGFAEVVEVDQFFDCRIEPTIDGVEDFSGCRHGRAG
jgi:hypothetical protein